MPRLVPLLAAVALCALAAPSSVRGQGRPVPPPLLSTALDAERLREGRWTYRATVARGAARVDIGERTLSVRGDTIDGVPAWVLVDETAAQGQVLRDSLVLDRATLQPVWQRADIGPVDLSLRFPGGNVEGALRLPDGTEAPIRVGGAPGLVATPGMLETLLSLAPLGSDWSASVQQLAVSPVGSALVPLTLTVRDTATVTVPAGVFTTWVVEVTAAEVAQRLWVDQATGRVVRSLSMPPAGRDVVYESVLTAVAPGATP